LVQLACICAAGQHWLAISGKPGKPSLAERNSQMGRIIVANRHGDQVVEWDPAVETEAGRAAVATAEQILAEARARGCAVSKKVDGKHVLDTGAFDPQVEEYQVIAPIAGG
jgi:hypothetical protein